MSKVQKTKKITILYGLPGSGKSTYAEKAFKNCSPWQRSMEIIDLDHQLLKLKRTKKELSYFISGKIKIKDHLILDGLITTNKQAKELIDSILNYKFNFDVEFEIVWWEENRETCLFNDIGRRAQSSEITIKNLVFEEPNSEFLGIKQENIHRKFVGRKPDSQVWIAQELKLGDSKVIESSSWSLGGTSRSYDGNEFAISAETPPTSFTRFDDLLEEICPNITFLQYRKVYNHCVTIETKSDSDYYSNTESSYFQCDLEKLYKTLRELNLIETDQ